MQTALLKNDFVVNFLCVNCSCSPICLLTGLVCFLYVILKSKVLPLLISIYFHDQLVMTSQRFATSDFVASGSHFVAL